MSDTGDDRSARERDLLAAARRDDEGAFRVLLELHGPELQAYCYRMLGSVHDAEDAQQEVLLRAWRGLAGFEGRSSLRSWLYRIATNVCLSAIEQRPRRVLPIDYEPADPKAPSPEPPGEGAWVEPYPDEALALGEGPTTPEAGYELRESVELAFVAALQYLSASQAVAGHLDPGGRASARTLCSGISRDWPCPSLCRSPSRRRSWGPCGRAQLVQGRGSGTLSTAAKSPGGTRIASSSRSAPASRAIPAAHDFSILIWSGA